MKSEEQIGLEKWVRECFKRENATEDYYPAFRKLFVQEMDQVNEEFGVNVVVDNSSWIDPDDTELGTCRVAVEKHVRGSFQGYLAALEDGHSTAYAEVYGPLIGLGESEERASETAYLAICNCNQPSPDNPAYQDAFAACRKQTGSDDLARLCAEFLYDYDFSYQRACVAAKDHEAARKRMLDCGHSEFAATMYAQALRNDISLQFAEVFARCANEQILAGRTESEAERFAGIYTDLFDDHGSFDENNEYHELANDHCMALAEAEYRYRQEFGEKTRFINTFDLIYQRLCYSPHSVTRDRFDEIEETTKKELAEPGSQLDPHGGLPQVKVAVDDLDESEHAKPLDFQIMSEAEFKSYRPRSEDEQSAYEEEDEYRKWCANDDMDPMDSDSRDLYKEICAEYDIDDMDDYDRDGWTDNLNKD